MGIGVSVRKIMNRLSCLVSLLLLSSFLSIPSAIATPNLISQSPESAAQKVDFGRHFRELGVEGSILIYDANNNQTFQHNSQRNQTAFLPVFTFKILNSLISLETGVIPDEIAVLTD
jgi:beta-lactamase class D